MRTLKFMTGITVAGIFTVPDNFDACKALHTYVKKAYDATTPLQLLQCMNAEKSDNFTGFLNWLSTQPGCHSVAVETIPLS